MKLVGARGFEPPTPCSQSRCATRLRHAPRPMFSMTYKVLAFSILLKTLRGNGWANEKLNGEITHKSALQYTPCRIRSIRMAEGPPPSPTIRQRYTLLAICNACAHAVELDVDGLISALDPIIRCRPLSSDYDVRSAGREAVRCNWRCPIGLLGGIRANHGWAGLVGIGAGSAADTRPRFALFIGACIPIKSSIGKYFRKQN